MKKLLFLLTLLCGIELSAASLQLINDSTRKLTAIIKSASGITLDTIEVQPGQTTIWTTDLAATRNPMIYREDASITPFTVIWLCEMGDHYSMCTDLASGASIKARACAGARDCRPKPKKKEGQNDNGTEDSYSKN